MSQEFPGYEFDKWKTTLPEDDPYIDPEEEFDEDLEEEDE